MVKEKLRRYLKFPERCIDLHSGEVHLLSKAIEDGHVELVHDVAEVLADHLLGQTLPSDQEPVREVKQIISSIHHTKSLESTITKS